MAWFLSLHFDDDLEKKKQTNHKHREYNLEDINFSKSGLLSLDTIYVGNLI